MAITGNLRTMQLSELLQWLSMGLKTGSLVIKGKNGEKRIYFQEGRILSSSSTLEREYLGHFLVGYGYITEEELTKAMQVQYESKILLGKILVMIGAINEEDLGDLIRLKAAETIYDIFLWTEGAFEFIDGEIPKMPMVPIAADVTGIVMEGLRRYDEWQRIRTKIKDVREIPSRTTPIDASALPERERLILDAIDGKRSIDEIAVATYNPDFHVAKLVYELLQSGKVTIVGTREAQEEELIRPKADGDEMVFLDAATSVFEPAEPAAAEPAPKDAPYVPSPAVAPRDASRFLRRSPDSSADGRTAAPSPRATPHFAPAAAPPAAPPAPSPRLVASQPAANAATKVATLPPKPPPAPPPKPAPPPPPTPAKSDAGESLTPSTALIPKSAVPKLVVPMDELMSWSFTPNEAFIVSRINGVWDIKSIVRISPFPEIEVLRVFQRLHAGGVIAWG